MGLLLPLSWRQSRAGPLAAGWQRPRLMPTYVPMNTASTSIDAGRRAGSNVLYDEHPRMFRNAPIAFIGALILVPLAGLGVIILLVWWLKCLTDRLTITRGEVVWRHGLLARTTTELHTAGIRSVRVHQSVTQRIFDTGTVSIFTSGDQPELVVKGLPHPQRIRDLVDQNA